MDYNKIKKLQTESNNYANSLKPFGLSEWHRLYSEHFVKSIIKECTDAASFVGKVNRNPVKPIHTTHAVTIRIQKRFGLK